MSGLSGWCSGPEGRCTSPKAHKVCAQRIRLGLLAHCECTRDGGHPPKEESAE